MWRRTTGWGSWMHVAIAGTWRSTSCVYRTHRSLSTNRMLLRTATGLDGVPSSRTSTDTYCFARP